MDKLIYTAMTGAKHLLGRQGAIAHNLANAVTNGYRAEEHRMMVVPLRSEALPTRAFAVEASVLDDFTPGPMMSTGRTLDVAVQGAGWIALSMPDGTEAYTRNGSLEVSAEGVLQTRGGIPVQGDGGPISIPPDNEITIAPDGTVSVVPRGGAQNTVAAVGRIKLVSPADSELVRGADGLFRMRAGGEAAAGERVVLASGFLEGSNVNVVDQMVAMIAASRHFEVQVQMMRNAEENDRAATQLLSNR